MPRFGVYVNVPVSSLNFAVSSVWTTGRMKKSGLHQKAYWRDERGRTNERVLEAQSIPMAGALDRLNSKVFAEQLHTNFKVHLGNEAPLSLELVAVNERETSPKIELFSLFFLGPLTPRLNQQIHQFEHEKLGAFDLFLTAVGADAAGTTYEVVFHRLRKEQP
jgi:hypothetical protein